MKSPYSQADVAVTMHPALELHHLFEQLKKEHVRLKQELRVLHERAKTVGMNFRIRNWHTTLKQLNEEVLRFNKELDRHSEWEEKEIFPLVTLHTGKSIGPFAALEQEHEIAKQYIDDFVKEMELVQDYVGSVQAYELASCLLQASYILNEHFRKEEELIYPFTDKMLEDTEQFFS